MQKTTSQANVYQLGIYGAIATIIGILFSGPLALVVVNLTYPQPATWQGVQVFLDNYHFIQSMPFFAGFFIVIGYLVMMAAIYQVAEEEHKIHTLIALLFTTAFATLIFFNYIVQTTFIPALVKNYQPAYDPVITTLSMANSKSLAWAIEMWGYGFLGLATWLAAPVFNRNKLEKLIANLLVLNGMTSIVAAIVTAINLDWAMTGLGLISYAIWNLLVLLISILVVVAFHRRGSAMPMRAERVLSAEVN